MLAFDRCRRLGRIGRRRAAPASDVWRVGHDVVEHAGAEPRRRPQQIAGDNRDPALHAVESGILGGQPRHIAL
jgi:hypothetical protein